MAELWIRPVLSNKLGKGVHKTKHTKLSKHKRKSNQIVLQNLQLVYNVATKLLRLHNIRTRNKRNTFRHIHHAIRDIQKT